MLTKDQCVVNDSPWAEQSRWENWERVANRAAITLVHTHHQKTTALSYRCVNLVCLRTLWVDLPACGAALWGLRSVAGPLCGPT